MGYVSRHGLTPRGGARPKREPAVKHLCLHVGLPKTGTSSIQVTLHAHRPVLAAAGITYMPEAMNHSALLVDAFGVAAEGAARRRARPRQPGVAEAARRALQRFIAEAPPGKLIISGEAASALGPEATRHMLGFLRAEVDRLSVIAFVRPPRSAVPSIAQQRAKHGVTAGKLLLPAVPNYRARIEPFLACADLAETILRLYAPGALREGCSVAEFLAACGVPPEVHARLRVRRVNASMSRAALVLLLAANAALPPSDPSRAPRLTALLTGLPGQPFEVPPAVMDRLVARPHKRAEIAWIEARLGQPFAAFEAPPPERWARDAPHPADWAERALADLDAAEVAALRKMLTDLPATAQAAARADALAWLDGRAAGVGTAELPALVGLLNAVAQEMPAPARRPGPGA